MKKSYFLLLLTLVVSVVALTTTLLLVRSQKIAEADLVMADYGNYDFAFCQATKELEDKIKEDSRFSKLGYLYDLGQAVFSDTGISVELGALQDKETERMYYVNPVQGRYPEKEGEICIDRFVLKGCGYETKIGQKITLSFPGREDINSEKEYTLVGIVEVQKMNEGMIYSTRKYPEKMFSVNNMSEKNYPFAYLSMEEAEAGFSCDTKHILADVADSEKTDEVIDTCLLDDNILENLHIDMSHAFGREWTALCILGSDYRGKGESIVDNLNTTIEENYTQEDAYTKYFIPILTVLIIMVSAIGIYDSVRMSTDERRENYGTLLGIGMTGGRILKYIVVEFLVMLVAGTAIGWLLGRLCYSGILNGIKEWQAVILPSALEMDTYYAPYINMVTRSPYIWPACAVCVVVCVGIAGAAVDLFHMTPLGLTVSKVHKKKRNSLIKGLYGILNRYVGRESLVNHFIPYIMVSMVMAVSVFGFLFFRAKADDDTSAMTEQLEAARINGVEYYMEQTEDVRIGYKQYMHNSGVTTEMYQKLEKEGPVETAKGVVIDYSTVLVYDKKEMVSNILKPQSEYGEQIGQTTGDKIQAKANEKAFVHYGINMDEQEVFHVPVVGVQQQDIEVFQDDVVAGELNEEKLCSGEEVAILLTDESLKQYFTVGEEVPLCDFVRPEDLDNSREWLVGQLPEKYQEDKAAYSVTADGVTQRFWDYDTLKKLKTRIGAVICIDLEEGDSFYFEDNDKGYTVNIMAGMRAFEKWGLPNKNYTRVGVILKDINTSKKFESKWMQLLQKSGYMTSIDAYNILEEKEKAQNRIMAVFYASLGVLIVISIICTGNSIAMRIQYMAREQRILHLLGMTAGRIRIMYLRRYMFMGLVGMVFSILPVSIYSCFVNYASHLADRAYENGTTEILLQKKPWVYYIPDYNLLEQGILPVLFIVGIITVILLAFLVLLQPIRAENDMSGKSEEEKSIV